MTVAAQNVDFGCYSSILSRDSHGAVLSHRIDFATQLLQLDAQRFHVRPALPDIACRRLPLDRLKYRRHRGRADIPAGAIRIVRDRDTGFGIAALDGPAQALNL